MEGIQEIGTIFVTEVRRAIRSGRVVVLLGLYTMFSGLLLVVVGAITNRLKVQVGDKLASAGADADQARQFAEEARKGVLGFLFSDDAAMLEALHQLPMVVLIVFKVSLLFLPFYVAIMGFDQTSGEVGPRSIRYLTIRARRSSILFGKFLSQSALLLFVVLAVDLGVFIYARIYNDDFTTQLMLLSLLKFWVASIVFSLAYLSLTACCSALFRTPAVSLVVNLICPFVFWIINAIGSSFVTSVPNEDGEGMHEVASGAAWIRYLAPSHYATNLLHPQFSHFGVSGAAYGVFALVFLGAAYAIIRARDL